jgi:GNAT superfamily N-acetyltransferase
MIFKKTTDFERFFKILPSDWQEGIVPFWDDFKTTTICYIIAENDEIIAGGLIFSSCPPDMKYAEKEAIYWLKKGYLYLGFIYVVEEKRGQNLGSFWLENLKKTQLNQQYWLTIEDLNLDSFYTKNGFKKVKSLFNEGVEEVIYVFEN